MNTKISVLDGFTMNPGDLSWKPLLNFGQVSIFEYTSPEQIIERCLGADIVIVNKTNLTEEIISKLPSLRCICVTATGINNINLSAAKKYNIPVYNVSGYSTDSVAQHVFALIFALQNKVFLHNASVQKGDWTKNRDFCFTLSPIFEIAGKTLGIYGFGKIGQQVSKIGKAFGMTIISHHKHPIRDARPDVKFVDWNTLIEKSDYLTLHAPLNKKNEGIINSENLSKMKSSAVLINTGRGSLINEIDLREALLQNVIQAAALDVLSIEPPSENNPLFGLNNCIITPHIAWASKEARQRLMDETVLNIKDFLDKKSRNSVG